jgi:Protein of unknown function (DUF3025)
MSQASVLASGWRTTISAMLTLPCFASIEPALRELRATPTLAALQALATHAAIKNAQGHALHFVAQHTKLSNTAYDASIHTTGAVPIRDGDWHDLFNALIWVTFPRTKAALNERQYHAGREHGGHARRGAVRDSLTLFDECGVLVVSCDPELLACVRGFQWKQLFWQQRARMLTSMRFLVFGHGLLQQLLAPYVGLTGKAILLDVPADFFAAPRVQQLRTLDARCCALIEDPDALSTPLDLAPIPLLGIPHWAGADVQERDYDNVFYFRPGRQRRAAAGSPAQPSGADRT